MGQHYTELTDQQSQFIQQQKLFFVATAAETGTVNISPKGMDSFRIINPNQVAWLNLTGSGNETSAHVQLNPRMTIMFCALDGSPLILRLYGTARVLHQAHPQWQKYLPMFPETAGTRQIFLLDIDKTQSSCGMAVPLFDYQGDRDALKASAERKGQAGVESYWKEKNQYSMDGFPTHIMELSGMDEG